MKKYFGGASYSVTGIKELIFNKAIPQYRVEISQPDKSTLEFEIRTLLLFINNGKYGGGHINFTPGAMINDGLLDVMFKTGDFGVKSGLNILDEAKAKHGKHVFREDIFNFRGKAIKIHNLNYDNPPTVNKNQDKKEKFEDVKPISFETPNPEDDLINI